MSSKGGGNFHCQFVSQPLIRCTVTKSPVPSQIGVRLGCNVCHGKLNEINVRKIECTVSPFHTLSGQLERYGAQKWKEITGKEGRMGGKNDGSRLLRRERRERRIK